MMPPPSSKWKLTVPGMPADTGHFSPARGAHALPGSPAPQRAWRSVALRHRAYRSGRPVAILLLAALLGTPGCGFVGFPGVYKIDIEQGNLVDQEMIEQLEPGMSRRQVRFIMGSPLVEDTLHRDRWDYPYVIRNGTNIIREAQVTVVFEEDRLVDVRGDYLPAWAAEAQTAQSDDESQSPPG